MLGTRLVPLSQWGQAEVMEDGSSSQRGLGFHRELFSKAVWKVHTVVEVHRVIGMIRAGV